MKDLKTKLLESLKSKGHEIMEAQGEFEVISCSDNKTVFSIPAEFVIDEKYGLSTFYTLSEGSEEEGTHRVAVGFVKIPTKTAVTIESGLFKVEDEKHVIAAINQVSKLISSFINDKNSPLENLLVEC